MKLNNNYSQILNMCRSIFKRVLIFVCACRATATMAAEEKVVFAIASDIHCPSIPEGGDNLTAFVKAARKHKADFMIELGDFCGLDDKSKPFRDTWNSFPGDKYHVIGNHDMDAYNADEYVKGMGMPGRYYSFDKGNFHFIVLDGNNLFDGQTYTHYQYGNFYRPYEQRAYLDPEQLEWLRADLAATDKKCVIFSHQSIDTYMNNGAHVRQILEEANRDAGFKKVVLAFSGHNHSNYTKVINDIIYIQINSASYVWCDVPTNTEARYPKEINDRYGNILKYSITYDAPLYGIVTLTDSGVKMKGRKARFKSPQPSEVGLGDTIDGLPLVSVIEDVDMKF